MASSVAGISKDSSFSTAEDLRRFGQMLLNRGTWNGRTFISSKLVDEMHRPADVHTSVPMYQSGLGFAIHTAKEEAMNYAVTNQSYGANGASGCIIWIDPSLELIRIYLTHYFLGDFRDGN
jgi:CubicO group peptidase (beta-lactamase class C family)